MKSENSDEAPTVPRSSSLDVQSPSLPTTVCSLVPPVSSVVSLASPSSSATSFSQNSIPLNSASLIRWEKKILDEANKQPKRVAIIPSAELFPSPVSSRTRTSLKRSSSFAGNDETYDSLDNNRTSVSLRKALARRLSKERPRSKKGKRSDAPDNSD